MGLDTDSIELLDFDYDVPCDVEVPDCDKPAEWILILSCCGKKLLICDEHFQSVLDDLNKDYEWYCPVDIGGCGAEGIKQPIAVAERLDKRHRV